MTQRRLCPVWVPLWPGSVSGGNCGRPVKRDGLCGIHAAANERRAANAATRQASREAQERAYRDAQKVADALTDATGIPFRVRGSVVSLGTESAATLLDMLRSKP